MLPNPLLLDSDEFLLHRYKNVNNCNEHGAVESIPLSINTLKFKVTAQNSAVIRIK